MLAPSRSLVKMFLTGIPEIEPAFIYSTAIHIHLPSAIT